MPGKKEGCIEPEAPGKPTADAEAEEAKPPAAGRNALDGPGPPNELLALALALAEAEFGGYSEKRGTSTGGSTFVSTRLHTRLDNMLDEMDKIRGDEMG